MPYQYALSLYRSDVVGGESDPNSVSPTHTVQAPGTGSEVHSALLYCIDGTSIVVTPWFKDITSGVWLPLIGATVTYGTPVIVDVPPGALLAFQLGTNTGGVTKFAVGFVAGDFELPSVGGSASSVSVTSSALPTGASTSANQTNGTQQTKLTDGSNLATVKAASTPAADADTALVVDQRAGTITSGTKATITTAVQINSGSVACRKVRVSNPMGTGTDSVWIGDSNVAVAKGTEILPGRYADFDVSNVNQLYVVATTGTQSVGFNVIA